VEPRYNMFHFGLDAGTFEWMVVCKHITCMASINFVSGCFITL
jgi:hypothetical protein